MASPSNKVVYIAGPMSGLPDFNYPAFIEAENTLREHGWTSVLNPVSSEKENTGEYQQQPWEWYLTRAVRMLTYANSVALLPGWENSKGAKLEKHIADSLGYDVRPLRKWMYGSR